jgi:hypothetical protein
VDVRGDGGYIVASPSLHASGKRYKWLEGAHPDRVPLPPLPKWLQSLVTEQVSKTPKPVGESIRDGERNTTLTSLAGAMRRHGATKEAILAALRKYNQERCEPPLPDKEMEKIAASVSRYAPAKEQANRKPSQVTQLVALAPDLRFFHTLEMEPYVTMEVDDHRETWRLRDLHFKRWLAGCFYKQSGGAPSSQTVNDALSVLEAQALFDGPEEEIFIRLAQRQGTVYLDLCNASWQAVEITSKGWKIISDPPVNFRRARGIKSLPRPVRGGSISELRPFLNVATDNDFVLFVSWLVAALNSRGPYPVLVLQGEAGSAKSTTERVLRELIDPNTTPLRSAPREVRDLMIAARNAWCVAFDNVSYLPQWLSDALCRLATGGGFSTRQLYTDDEEKLFEAIRPILLNGIDGVVTRGDLMDRSMITYLPIISDEQRRPEKEFWRLFHKAQPRILGALLNAVSCGLRRLPRIKLDRLPRMADFAEWVTAAEPALGWSEGTFMRAYDANRASANSLALEASSIVAPLRRLAASGPWEGTAEELLNKLERLAHDKEDEKRDWPKSAWWLSIMLRRIAPSLRATGIDVRFGKTAGSGSRRLVSITTLTEIKPPGMARTVEQGHKEPGPIQRFPRLRRRFPRLKSEVPDEDDLESMLDKILQEESCSRTPSIKAVRRLGNPEQGNTPK